MTTAPKQKRGPSKPASGQTTVPDWAKDTPEIEYSLLAYLEHDLEVVDVTREEYIALKGHLAKMRGLSAAKPGKAA